MYFFIDWGFRNLFSRLHGRIWLVDHDSLLARVGGSVHRSRCAILWGEHCHRSADWTGKDRQVSGTISFIYLECHHACCAAGGCIICKII